jgi:uncharacterized protein
VSDPDGEQVADLVAFNADDIGEMISSGRSLDYQNTIFLTKGHSLYSNRSNVLLQIVEDDVGRHDFLLAPCSKEMFRLTYGDEDPAPGCFGNLSMALQPFGVNPDHIPVAFNIFMHVSVNGETGELAVLPPRSRPGDCVKFRAAISLIIGLTACSALQSNNYAFKPIHYRID